MIKVLHYLNQFFAGIGGEEKAGQEVIFLPQAVGIGVEIERSFKQRGVEYATLACGDNYFHEQEEQALQCDARRHRPVSARFLPGRPSLQRRPIRYRLRQGVQLGARQLAYSGDHRHARKQSGHPGNRPPSLRRANRRLHGVHGGGGKTLFSAGRTVNRARPSGAEAFRAEHCLPIPRRFTVRTAKPDYVRAVDLMLAKLNGETYESEIPLIATARHMIPNLTGSSERRHGGARHRRRSRAQG